MQNWIGAHQTPLENAAYIPPEPRLLPELLDNWEKYYHMERPDSLVQLAVVHAQFEIIHPFLDGNGRLGRILIPLYLYEKSVCDRGAYASGMRVMIAIWCDAALRMITAHSVARQRLAWLAAHRVACPHHVRFLTSTRAYELYVEYWNGKLALGKRR